MPAPEIAVAYVSIVPSLQGFAGDLRRQVVGPTGEAGTQASGAFSGALKAGLAAGAVAAGAVLVKGLTDAIEQANITKKLQGQLGATSKDAARYGKVAGSLFSKNLVGTFEEGAEAIRAVVNGGLVPPGATNKQLESIAQKMSDVSTTFGTDMNRQSEAVSAMLKNGLAPDAEAALDVITLGFQKLGPNAEDLLDTFQEYSIQFKKMGIDSNEALGLFQQGIQAGARDTDIIADAFKEFSIRSVDGSKAAAESYKALGLDADKMMTQFGKGGDSAGKGLQTVLDKLRSMKDPVAREAAAVGLFGTQAEDLGTALFALDPSKAVGALGKVDGAAGKLGKTIHSGPMHELQAMARGLQQDLVDAMTKYAIPVILKLAGALRTTADKAVGAWNWVKDVAPYVAPLAVAIAGLTLALNANAIATGLVTAVFNVYRAAILIGTAVTSGFSIAMGILNAIMALNPFVLVAIAIVALGVALYVAYQKSETFRNIVQACFKAVGDAAIWLWEKAIKPTFNFIAELFKWLYTIVVVIVLAPIILYIKMVAAIYTWLWKVAVKPALTAIGELSLWLWKNAIKPAWDNIKKGMDLLGKAVAFLWSNYVKPAFQSIADKGKWVWEKALKPAFDFLKKGVKAVGNSFKDAKDLISKQWSKLEDIAKKPVKFIIDTIYNAGIVPLWNKIAKVVGGKTLDKISTKGFAEGGYTGNGSKYTPAGIVHAGEFVTTKAATASIERSSPGALEYMNRHGKLPGYSSGGLVGKVGGLLSKGWDWAKDTVGGVLGSGFGALKKLIASQMPEANTGFGKLIKGVPASIFNSLTKFGKEKEDSFTGGPGVANALRWARTQNGKPYQWGGAGNPSWDCSGFMSGISKAIIGKNPKGRLWSTFSFQGDNAPAGWVRGLKAPFQIGVTNNGVGHTAGTLGGVNVESRGGDGVVVGSRARGANSSLFQNVYGYAPSRKYDNGGYLMPGQTATTNLTGKPEPVLTDSQWNSMHTLAASGAGGLQDGDRLVLVTAGGEFEAYVDKRADSRIKSTLVDPAALGRK